MKVGITEKSPFFRLDTCKVLEYDTEVFEVVAQDSLGVWGVIKDGLTWKEAAHLVIILKN